jgi:hypothetical protein
MSNINIFMRIMNVSLPNLPISYADGDYKNDSNISTFTSGGFIELVDASLKTGNLLYPIRFDLFVEFY